MKIIIEKVVFFAFCCIMLSCTSTKSKNTPEYVSEAFAMHFYNWQFEECLQYTTVESKAFLQFCASNVTEENISQIRSLENDATVEIIDIVQPDDTTALATIRINSFLHADTIGKALKAKETGIATIRMSRRNDIWKVNLSTPPSIKTEE